MPFDSTEKRHDPILDGTVLFVLKLMGAIIGAASALVCVQDTTLAQKASVDDAVGSYRPVPKLSGRLTVAGSETMQPLLIRLAADFHRRYPDVKIGVEGGGSAAAMTEFLEASAGARRGDGNVTGHEGSFIALMMASSREMSTVEINRFYSRHHYLPTAVPIAVDAVALYVHKDNPISGLTLDQVDAIFSRTRQRGYPKKIDRWGMLGLINEWEQAAIRLYGRDRNSGTRRFFAEQVLANGEFDFSVEEKPGLASIMLAVSQDRFGIGYGGIGFLSSAVRAVPLAEGYGMPFISPSASIGSDGPYPLRRFLYLYVNKPPQSSLSPALHEFLAFVNSREGQDIVVRNGFYPLAANQVIQNLASVAATSP